MQQKKKRYTLVYSRRIHDNRIYGNNIYKQHFLDILAARCTNEVEEAKSRVIITNEGKYMYTPSREYTSFYKEQKAKRRIDKNET